MAEDFHCSWKGPDIEHPQMCTNEVKWVCRIDVGPWMLGWWGCDDHRESLEQSLPIVDTLKGKYVIPVMGQLIRNPIILPLDYLQTGQMGTPMPSFTCDSCGKPIQRQDGQWVHSTTVPSGHDLSDHEAYPG